MTGHHKVKVFTFPEVDDGEYDLPEGWKPFQRDTENGVVSISASLWLAEYKPRSTVVDTYARELVVQ